MYIQVPEYLRRILRRFEEMNRRNPNLLSAQERDELDDIVCDVVYFFSRALKTDSNKECVNDLSATDDVSAVD